MSGGKASGKQPKDTTVSDDALHAPHDTHTDANVLKDDMSTCCNQFGGKSQEARQDEEEGRDTAKPTNEQPDDLSVDAFPAALGSLPLELWEIFIMNNTWSSDRTIMLRMTSKRVKELVDKMRPTVVVCWRRSFMEEEWYELRVNGTVAEKLCSFSDSLRCCQSGVESPHSISPVRMRMGNLDRILGWRSDQRSLTSISTTI
jgi:hypothetical protein